MIIMTSFYTSNLNFHCNAGWRPHPMLNDWAESSLLIYRHPGRCQSCIFFMLNFCPVPLLTQNEHSWNWNQCLFPTKLAFSSTSLNSNNGPITSLFLLPPHFTYSYHLMAWQVQRSPHWSLCSDLLTGSKNWYFDWKILIPIICIYILIHTFPAQVFLVIFSDSLPLRE